MNHPIRGLLASALGSSALAGCAETAAPLPPSPPALLVSVEASGYPAAWEYQVMLDGSEIFTVRSGATAFASLQEEGTFALELAVPEGCAVTEENPRTIAIDRGETLSEHFTVDCRGVLRFRVETSGTNPPDGYALSINDEAPIPVALNQSLELTDRTAQRYDITLDGVPPNCSPEHGNIRSTYLEPRDTLLVTFTIECLENAGSVEVTSVVAGQRSDFLVLGIGYLYNVPPNTTIVLWGIPAGDYAPRLFGLEPECEWEITGDLVLVPDTDLRLLPIRDRQLSRITVTVACP